MDGTAGDTPGAAPAGTDGALGPRGASDAAAAAGHTLVLIRTTVGTEQQAREMAARLVGIHLAACVHFYPFASVYRWKGAVQDDAEYAVEARCIPEREGDVRQAMLEGHPYEEPLVEAWTVRGVPAGYFAWAQHGTGS
ncbi:MAG TPA: divalent-cation tolerance protein CutA [Candidatus Thermoplasmatota archaeon]|nr:divalent-cation tolerance protein CutA [Candidatus Thermoplasmatota archaeon]